MSENPIYDRIDGHNKHSQESPIYNKIVKPEPVLGPITDPVPSQGGDHGVNAPKKWWEKVLNPVFRRWAYGVTAAAVTAGAIWAGKPEFITVAAPLIMAIFYVDKSGEPHV